MAAPDGGLCIAKAILAGVRKGVWQHNGCMWLAQNGIAPMMAAHICGLCIMGIVEFHRGLALQSCLGCSDMGLCGAVGPASAQGMAGWAASAQTVKHAAHTVESA